MRSTLNLRRNKIQWILETMAFAGVLAIGGLAMFHASAHAGCDGGRYRNTGGYGGGHAFRAGYGIRAGGCGGGCGMAGMSMPRMAMPAMNMAGYAPQTASGYAPSAYPPAAPQPAAAGAQFTCPMHPSVVSATPANCPYYHIAF